MKERCVSLTYEEINALLEMSMLTYAEVDENAASSALIKLGAVCREFAELNNASTEPLVKAA